MILRGVLVLSLSLALPAAAQQRVVVPEGVVVAVPARGLPVAPRAAAPGRRSAGQARHNPRPLPPAEPDMPAAMVAVPLAAAAAVAAALLSGGGGGGVSAPVRTR